MSWMILSLAVTTATSVFVGQTHASLSLVLVLASLGGILDHIDVYFR